MTLLFSHEVFLKHVTGAHPENPERLRSITRQLENSGALKRCQRAEFQPLAEEGIDGVHSPALRSRAKQLAQHGGGSLDADTVLCAESFDVALAAAGACVAAVDAVMRGKDTRALCLVRPPGHHATPTQSMGFCLFNNVALAARHALDKHQLNRILIVDFDVHHGNGTQDVFYEESRVLFLSIHRYGHGFYPGTGSETETGLGAGLGYTVNVPVRYGIACRDYHGRYRQALEKAADKVKPELVLISAGFDAHRLDPVGSLGLEAEDFSSLTQQVLAVAAAHASGRLVSCLEGGYHLRALAESVQAHVDELLSATSQASR
jgi:acetoin utilization deacetylase AcuC-like enzyme